MAELVWQEGASKADIEPSTADRIEHGELAGELQGMIKRGQHGTGDQPRALRALEAAVRKMIFSQKPPTDGNSVDDADVSSHRRRTVDEA